MACGPLSVFSEVTAPEVQAGRVPAGSSARSPSFSTNREHTGLIMPSTHDSRTTIANQAPVNPSGEYVLYWMIAFRRTNWNHSIDRAVAWAAELNRPLLVFEGLRCGYPWASQRLHRFILEGMVDNGRALAKPNVSYYPYVEPSPGDGKGLLAELAARACVVVTDDFPAFFLPRMVSSAALALPVMMEKIDSNGIFPLSEHTKVFSAAFHFRHYVHGSLLEDPFDFPRQRPFAGRRLATLDNLPKSVTDRWPPARLETRSAVTSVLEPLPVDDRVPPVSMGGGSRSARRALRGFLDEGLLNYAELRNHPEADATSGLSPYLHFGHLSSYEVLSKILERQGWSPDLLEPAAKGRREGFWGVDANAEGFLDELVTWRELGFSAAKHQPSFDSYRSLPEWAQVTLGAHASDAREHDYALEQFESADTHDQIWNAAQRQLLTEGRLHGYLRMLWGKKILEWSESPQTAFEIMVELNNKYALDGRDPNSYSGILWVLGKYDRPWAPERPVFGKVRYMSSKNTARKFRLQSYLERYGN